MKSLTNSKTPTKSYTKSSIAGRHFSAFDENISSPPFPIEHTVPKSNTPPPPPVEHNMKPTLQILIALTLLSIPATPTIAQSQNDPAKQILQDAATALQSSPGFTAKVTLQGEGSKMILSTMPAMTAVLAALFLGDRLAVRLVLALAIVMAGLAVLVSEDFAAMAAAPLGPAVMALSALSWALGNVALKSRHWSLPPISLTVWFFVVSSVLCWPLVLAFEAPWAQPSYWWPCFSQKASSRASTSAEKRTGMRWTPLSRDSGRAAQPSTLHPRHPARMP